MTKKLNTINVLYNNLKHNSCGSHLFYILWYMKSGVLGSLIIIENVNSKGHYINGDDELHNKGLFADDNACPRAIEVI